MKKNTMNENLVYKYWKPHELRQRVSALHSVITNNLLSVSCIDQLRALYCELSGLLPENREGIRDLWEHQKTETMAQK